MGKNKPNKSVSSVIAEMNMRKEIRRQIAEFDRKNANELYALVLWSLHSEFGFGKVRLRRFFDNFRKSYDDLLKQYEMKDEDMAWIATQKLKEYGIDVEEWNR